MGGMGQGGSGGMGQGGMGQGGMGQGGGMQGGDTCATAPVVGNGSYQGTYTGATNDYDPTSAGCTTWDEVGPDVAYSVILPAGEDLTAIVFPDTADASIYIVTDCSNLSSCVAGADEGGPGSAEGVGYTNPTNQPQTLFIIVDAYNASDDGDFTLSINIGDETVCTDFNDNDGDGEFDCGDATACQGSAACTVGASAIGAACTANTQCTATGSDPACLTDTLFGFPGGYCSEWCNLAADDCSGDGICFDFGVQEGLCLDGCAVNGDCRAGYYCEQLGPICLNIPAACSAATAATLGSNAGDTTGAPDGMDSGCSDGGERVFSFTPSTSGSMDLTLSSATDQGVSVRSPECAQIGDEVGCVDDFGGGTDETLSVPVTAGTTYFIIVEGYFPGDEGPFTLDIAVN
jgi:hypothetical protein